MGFPIYQMIILKGLDIYFLWNILEIENQSEDLNFGNLPMDVEKENNNIYDGDDYGEE